MVIYGGTIAAMILLATYLTMTNSTFYVKSKINREHVKYLLSYSFAIYSLYVKWDYIGSIWTNLYEYTWWL